MVAKKEKSKLKTLKNYKQIVEKNKGFSKEKFNGLLLGLSATTNNRQIHAWLNKQKK